MDNKTVNSFSIFIVCLFFYSCQPSKIYIERKKDFTDLGVEWTYSLRVNEMFKSKIDSIMDVAITQFNNEHHSFLVHKKISGEEDFLSLSFDKGRFVSDGGQAAGYIISGLGVIVSPIISLSSSGGKSFLTFWYLPHDNLIFHGTFSPSISNNIRPQKMFIQSGALFSNKQKRWSTITWQLANAIQQIFLDIDRSSLKKDNANARHRVLQ